MSLSGLINSAISGLESTSASAIVSIQDAAYHVYIGTSIGLGFRDTDDPDTSRPNPVEIRYTQEFEIVTHKVVGNKPITQCTIPVGLWEISMKFNTLKGSDDDLSQTLEDVKKLDAGPRKIYTTLFRDGKCCYLRRKEIVQPAGSDDWYHTVELQFIEANGGPVDDIEVEI